MTKRVLFLFSDTGGGHRSATEATMEAMATHYPQIQVSMIDVFKTYAPYPFNHAGRIYPHLTNSITLWEGGYKFLNHPSRTQKFAQFFWPLFKQPFQKLLTDHPADLIVSFHPLFNHSLSFLHLSPPHAVVVTDLATTHAFWFAPGAQKYLVPTTAAQSHAHNFGISPNQVSVTGLPVSSRFSDLLSKSVSSVRQQLGLHPSLPTILMMAGGEGMGNIYRIAQALSKSRLQFQIIIVAGRNLQLKTALEQLPWTIPHHIYGFTKDIPSLMRASDLVITKGGPSTIAEALTMGLPIIINDFLPGQETGNVELVTSNSAGVLAPTPDIVVSTLTSWLTNPQLLAKFKASTHNLSFHHSATTTAQEIHQLL